MVQRVNEVCYALQLYLVDSKEDLLTLLDLTLVDTNIQIVEDKDCLNCYGAERINLEKHWNN